MSLFVITKLFASLVTGMLGIPIGILPSVFLFRDLANGVDDSAAAKRNYALTLWLGMLAGWIIASLLSWSVITYLFG
ncbi:MAG: hypothetical protein ACR2O8_15715 [Rhizobiaceae bacterium]